MDQDTVSAPGHAPARERQAPSEAEAAVCRIELGPALVLATATELHGRLAGLLAEPAPVVLDVAAVTRIDTAGLQLLHAFIEARRTEQRDSRWENLGAAVRDAAKLLGLQSMLGPSATAATAHS